MNIPTPINLAMVGSTETNGSVVAVTNLPSSLAGPLLRSISNFSPRLRNIITRLDFNAIDIGDRRIKLPMSPFVESNRFYISIQLPFQQRLQKLVMSDDFDAKLATLPNNWDRNYNANSNIYEIVNEQTNPVLQVIYKAPDHIHVNGIFFVDGWDVYESFDPQWGPALLSLSMWLTNKVTGMATNIAFRNYNDFYEGEMAKFDTNNSRFYTNQLASFSTNEVYRWYVPGQKAIFKYPSYAHPGEFAK